MESTAMGITGRSDRHMRQHLYLTKFRGVVTCRESPFFFIRVSYLSSLCKLVEYITPVIFALSRIQNFRLPVPATVRPVDPLTHWSVQSAATSWMIPGIAFSEGYKATSRAHQVVPYLHLRNGPVDIVFQPSRSSLATSSWDWRSLLLLGHRSKRLF